MSETTLPKFNYIPQKPEYECDRYFEMIAELFPNDDEPDFEDEGEEESPKPSETVVVPVQEPPIPKVVVAFGSKFDPSRKYQHRPYVSRNDLNIPSAMIDSQFCDSTYKTISGELAKSKKRGPLGYTAPRFKTSKMEKPRKKERGRPSFVVEEEKLPKPCYVPFNLIPEKPPKVTTRDQPVLSLKVVSCRRLPRLHCFGGYAPILPGVDIVSETEGPPSCAICGKVIINQDYYHRELRDFVCLACFRERKYMLLQKFKLPEFNYFRPARDFQYIFADPTKRDITTLRRKVAKTAYMAWYTTKPTLDT